MRFIDSHTHLADPAFADDVDAVIGRARESGAVALVAIGESLASAARARPIAERHRGFVFWTAGVHPHDAAGYDPARDLPALEQAVAAGAVAVGECGLDYHYDHSPRPLQRRAFAEQLALAGRTGRPVVVHTREAEDDTAAMVREAGAAGIRGVMHCFTGSHALAHAALEAGWYISFSGIVTFKKWDDDALLRLVPDDRVLVESDAPYLAPVPNRGKRNEPAWVAHTVARVAAARGVAADTFGDLVTTNAIRFFGLQGVQQ
ncbi:MAG: TatD family hydrolase [Gemmatimonadetes bacterium]|nr:TatD family hydrolase [Gemmatimonadota bacterium]